MIKAIWTGERKPGLSDEDFYGWWHDVHGLQEFGRTQVRRYVQHHTLPETRDGSFGLTPTHDGASIGWFDDFDQMRASYAAIDRSTFSETGFDRSKAPHRVVAEERVVVDGTTTPEMVKAIVIASRHPDLSIRDFQQRWYEVHGPMFSRVPGVRRYVQNHALSEAYDRPYDGSDQRRPGDDRRITHDGWSEIWFDDLASMRDALATPERRQAEEDASTLFASPFSVVVGRESPIVG